MRPVLRPVLALLPNSAWTRPPRRWRPWRTAGWRNQSLLSCSLQHSPVLRSHRCRLTDNCHRAHRVDSVLVTVFESRCVTLSLSLFLGGERELQRFIHRFYSSHWTKGQRQQQDNIWGQFPEHKHDFVDDGLIFLISYWSCILPACSEKVEFSGILSCTCGKRGNKVSVEIKDHRLCQLAAFIELLVAAKAQLGWFCWLLRWWVVCQLFIRPQLMGLRLRGHLFFTGAEKLWQMWIRLQQNIEHVLVLSWLLVCLVNSCYH